LLAFLFAFGSLPAMAAAQAGTQVVIDLKDLDDFTRNKVMTTLKEKESASKGVMDSLPKIDPNSAREWAKVVTETIKDVCHNLNVEVNEFIKTPVGMLVAGTIIYKVIGKDLVKKAFNTLFGILGWMSTMIIVYFVAKRFIIPRKIKSTKEYFEGDKKITETSYKFIKPYDFKSDDARTAAVSFMAGTAIVSTFVTILVVLL
jgi:phage host-nuclease inhibitor protein Gam